MSLEQEIKELREAVIALKEEIASQKTNVAIENCISVASEPETVSKDADEVEVAPEPTPEVKKPSGVSLNDLKSLAQAKVKELDRATVKATIGKYADKLSDVKRGDYFNLRDDLNALGGE